MHRMNANRISEHGTSASLEDDSLRRIHERVKSAQARRQSKHQKSANIKKVASKISNQEPAQNTTKRLIIASIQDIPEEFERIGTGFFRQGHHLWQLSPIEGGFTLTRKHSEDHVLGYDPEPVSPITVITDRHGKTLSKGAKVTLPHRGKVANATIVVLQPGAVQVELDGGGMIDAPPDMMEMEEPEPPQAGAEFEPEIEPSSKMDDQEPQSELELEPESDYESDYSAEYDMGQRVAQTDPEPTTQAPAPQPSAELPTYEGTRSRIAQAIDRHQGNPVSIYAKAQNQQYYARKVGDKYALYLVETNLEPLPNVSSDQDLIAFENNIGYIEVAPIGRMTARIISAALTAETVNLKSWRDYWHSVGQRVAQTRKVMTPQQKEQRKRRREERKQERVGLPPGTVVPPKPKKAADDSSDSEARLKEKLRLYEQLVDEIEYILQDEELLRDEARLADELQRMLDDYHQQCEEMEGVTEDAMDDKLDIETPPKEPAMPMAASRVEVSMTDL